MGVTFQAFSISAQHFADLSADPDAADRFVREHYCTDVVGEDFETVWLDKTGLGILEAFGLLSGNPEPAVAWMTDPSMLQIGDESSPCLPPEQTASVAELMAQICDADFAERAQSNMMDTDVDYLTWGFARLRDLVVRAAEQQRAVVLYTSG